MTYRKLGLLLGLQAFSATLAGLPRTTHSEGGFPR
jgi:hypothetical protein